MCIDNTSKSNESTCQPTSARVGEQTCIVRNLNRNKIITPIISIISRIGITLHATKGRSAISPLHVFLSIAIDFVSRPPESSPAQNKTFHTFFMLIQATPKHITLEVISHKKRLTAHTYGGVYPYNLFDSSSYSHLLRVHVARLHVHVCACRALQRLHLCAYKVLVCLHVYVCRACLRMQVHIYKTLFCLSNSYMHT